MSRDTDLTYRRLNMVETAWNPACSFCGATRLADLVRAGDRDYWICSKCIEHPVLEDELPGDVICTFCLQVISRRRDGSSPGDIVVARRGAVLCQDCLQICVQLIAEGRALRARRPQT